MTTHENDNTLSSEPWEEMDFAELAANRSFAELSAREESAVLATLGSPQAYDRLHRAIQITRGTFEKESGRSMPREAVRNSLLTEMKRRSRTTPSMLTTFIAEVMAYRIPAFAAAGLVVATCICVIFIGRFGVHSNNSAHERIVYVPTAVTGDTSQEREALITRVVDSMKEEFRQELAIERESSTALNRGGTQKVAIKSHRQWRRADSNSALAHVNDTATPVLAAGIHYSSLRDPSINRDNIQQLNDQRRGTSLGEDSAYLRFHRGVARDSF